jgi:GNAT superfamily N-acetyltransferase
MDTLSPTGIVEEFLELWSQSDLADKMPEPGLMPNGEFVELNTIGILDAHQGRGYASRALCMLTDLCDAHGVPIKLVARPMGPDLPFTPGCPMTRTTAELVAWYTRHGFVETRGPEDDTREMVRYPTARPPSGPA